MGSGENIPCYYGLPSDCIVAEAVSGWMNDTSIEIDFGSAMIA